jgi:ATP-dependent Clp protease ATP-binding subunit ClpA
MAFMRELFPRAEQEATALGDELPGPEHLLLSALLMPEDPTARELLEGFGVTTDEMRSAIGRVHAAALETVGLRTDAGLASPPDGLARKLEGPFRSSGAAQVVFQRAVALAKEKPRVPLRAAHILLAVVEQERGTSARALADLGVDRAALVEAGRAKRGADRQ